MSQRHPNDFVVMVMDKAGWHQAKDLKVPPNMRIWEEIRDKWFPHKVFKSLDAVKSVLDSLEQSLQKVDGITGFDWIINLILKAS